jgi:hypothetical protein
MPFAVRTEYSSFDDYKSSMRRVDEWFDSFYENPRITSYAICNIGDFRSPCYELNRIIVSREESGRCSYTRQVRTDATEVERDAAVDVLFGKIQYFAPEDHGRIYQHIAAYEERNDVLRLIYSIELPKKQFGMWDGSVLEHYVTLMVFDNYLDLVDYKLRAL